MFCGSHKTDGMVNLKSQRCQHESCTMNASYGEPGGKRMFCKSHKIAGMVILKSNRIQHESCTKYADYSEPGGKPMFCGSHNTAGMVSYSMLKMAAQEAADVDLECLVRMNMQRLPTAE